ncbi:MAG: bifunctional (p)ppGpp synthetase/guanosine-3',5'-bis(diphosphate) 3'-pyrophosphohydrolase [Nitrospinae bacterium]|nr:bifunctional (p)ppGpp synthetase/guanosine-3',5'-bis(diphosphate) 3'-pyrophosphohydrolase [Nitrospinota bacterium]
MPERVVRLQDITETFLSDNPQADIDIIWKAYVYSAKVHRGQTRLSGSPYLFHPLEVAYILSKMKLDTCTIAAGLLHDTVEDVPQVTLEEIEEFFGEEVAFLVDGVTKISRMSFSSTEERQAENFRKIILAMAKDIRVILIKLADRLHNMRTIGYQAPQKQREIAQETVDIYAPIAHRLGIGWLKSELEDLSFKCLHPEEYEEIQAKIERSFEERERFIGEIRKRVVAELESMGIPGRVEGRPKHIYSIFRKIKRQDIEFHDVYDLTALRVITDTVRNCYAILGIIHSLGWQPIPGRFKDFIALAKPNLYQSLHTTVIGPKGERVEFQIRTEKMHQIAEEGIAAHWRYKAGLSKEEKYEEGLLWLRRMLDWQQEMKDPKEFMDALRIDLFPDEVYVFTPKGAVKNLSRGSTPVDFAYSVHTEVGDQCVGARVNHRMVALEYQLKSGDIVEILTSPSHTPSRDWLKFVQTSKARARIRSWIKSEQKERSRELGQEILEKQLQKYGLDPEGALKGKERELSEVARRLGFTSWEELLAGVGFGKVSAIQVIHKLFPEEELEKKLEKKREKLTLKTLVGKVVTRKSPHEGIRVKGVEDILVRFARCCSPVPGDEIIGYITRGRGISVHTIDCPTMAGLADDRERKIEIEWDGDSTRSFPIRIKVETVDRPGMLGKISSAIAAGDVNISWANVETTQDRRALLDFILEIKSLEQLNKVLRSIREVKGVLTVERVRDLSWMPEEEDLS